MPFNPLDVRIEQAIASGWPDEKIIRVHMVSKSIIDKRRKYLDWVNTLADVVHDDPRSRGYGK